MAQHSSNILELARRGAQQRYEELTDEINSLVRQFPDLRGAAREAAKGGRRIVKAAAEALRPRKRRKLSAAARKAISDAQKARWAKQKAQAGDTNVRKSGKKR
jgi:hypothetical protein